MTGMVFAQVLKFKEIDSIKFQNRMEKKKGNYIDNDTERAQIKECKSDKVNLDSHFALTWINRVLLDN